LKIANHGPGRRESASIEVNVIWEREADFSDFLKESLPGLAQAPILQTRTCCYADSWDGDFYISPVPIMENLFIASGGSGYAFKFAPLLGNWIADAFEGNFNTVLERFCWREPIGRETEEARYAGG
jgi:glycine/D-amino acid oxidase-like deaminating enzyme